MEQEREREREGERERRQKNGKVMYNYRVITGRMLAITSPALAVMIVMTRGDNIYMETCLLPA